jgi:nitrate/TMAO reductase-like tetraheme cytochrome c subunit
MTEPIHQEPDRPSSDAPGPVVTPPAAPAVTRKRRSRWSILLAALAAIGFLLVFFIGSTELLHWTESTTFCSLCHVMKPEYTTYHNSDHARAECGTCHIGPGALPAIQAKLANVRYLWVYPTNTYERPIPSPIHSLRPVDVVCEQCHWPEKFYADRVVVKNEYATDADNSLTQVALNIRTGGGRLSEGYGRGIHWHIANPVYYIATDEDRQEIPWVSAEFNGVTTEYLSVDTTLTPDALAQYEKRRMDCVDCHNRASHDFRRPSEVLDESLAQGVLPNLPNIKEQGVKVLEQQYATEQEAAVAIAAVADYYQNEQPAVFAQREGEVRTAVQVMQGIFDRTQFPFMNVNWQSHPNNIGHKDFPGCFRCHDGKHLSADNQAIRLECNVCHTIPEVAGPGQALQPISSVAPTNEPESHRSTTWLAEHRYQFDASCESCHTIDNPGGSDNTSFCSNAACHATEWQFAGLNAPRIRELSAPPKSPSTGVPDPVPHPLNATTDCTVCHALDKVRPFPENHATFTNDMCTGCHTPTLPVGDGGQAPEPGATAAPGAAPVPGETPATPPAAAPAAAPAIPHQLEGMGECTLCHALDAMKPFPENHTAFTLDMCVNCHMPAN